jgi:hypothetical protein
MTASWGAPLYSALIDNLNRQGARSASKFIRVYPDRIILIPKHENTPASLALNFLSP